MRLHMILFVAGTLAGCASSQTPEPEVDEGPLIYRTVIEADGIPFEVSWDRKDRTRATTRVFGDTGAVTIDVTNIVSQATGCRVDGFPKQIPDVDGVPTYLADVDCSPAKVLTQDEVVRSRELAREIDLALKQVSSNPPNVQTVSAPVNDEPASLFEGSPFSAFTATDIERFCAARWETRVGPDGRTEYNPCKRRDAFR